MINIELLISSPFVPHPSGSASFHRYRRELQPQAFPTALVPNGPSPIESLEYNNDQALFGPSVCPTGYETAPRTASSHGRRSVTSTAFAMAIGPPLHADMNQNSLLTALSCRRSVWLKFDGPLRPRTRRPGLR